MDAPRALISVVIPCYNHARYLAEAIESARACSFPTQIVVVDDGSTDGAADVAAHFPVTLIRQENRGLASARNRGLEAAIGDLVVFLDADDRMLPNGLETAAITLFRNPSYAFAYGRCLMMDARGTLLPPSAQSPTQHATADHYAALLRGNPIWTPAAAIFRREAVVRAGGFAQGFDAAADYDLYLRIARDRPIGDHGQLVAAYRQTSASMSGSAARMLRDTLRVARRHRGAAARRSKRDAWRDGYARWQDFYGTRLVEEIRAHVHAREWRPAFWKTLVLLRLAPGIAVRELRRAIRTRYAGRVTRPSSGTV